MRQKLKLGVLVSGRGSNLQAIIDNATSGKLNATVSVVISDNKDAYAITIAKNSKIPVVIVERQDFSNKKSFESAIADELDNHHVGLVCLAGFMRVLSKNFLKRFPGKIINIHPALLPSFPGLDAQKQALEHGVKISGCTVHFVDEGTDCGPIILQRTVPVLEDDKEETLSERILREEHLAYSSAIELISKGRLEICGRRVVIRK